MKPKPFASLNHFTVPFATLQTPSTIRGTAPTLRLESGALATATLVGPPEDESPRYNKAAGNILCGAGFLYEVEHQPPGQLLAQIVSVSYTHLTLPTSDLV